MVEQVDEWPGDLRKPVHRPGEDRGDALGIIQREAFRDKFTNNDRQVGDDRHDKEHRQDVGVFPDDRNVDEDVSQLIRDVGSADRTSQHTHEGDTDLDS